MGSFSEVRRVQDVIGTAETERAVLCVINGAEHWIPKSQIDDDSEVYGRGHEGELVISEWIAQQKGL